MRILAYLCIHIVILTQSFPSVECLPITDCLEGDECGEQRQMTTNVPTQVTPTTTSWSFRRIICPPFFPDLKETLFELERMIYEKTRQGYDAAKEVNTLTLNSPEFCLVFMPCWMTLYLLL